MKFKIKKGATVYLQGFPLSWPRPTKKIFEGEELVSKKGEDDLTLIFELKSMRKYKNRLILGYNAKVGYIKAWLEDTFEV